MDLPPVLLERLRLLGVALGDVEERFVRGSGPGGQKINKTSSTVVLRHRPTGIEVRCQQERSQAANRATAWAELCRRPRFGPIASLRGARPGRRAGPRRRERWPTNGTTAAARPRADSVRMSERPLTSRFGGRSTASVPRFLFCYSFLLWLAARHHLGCRCQQRLPPPPQRPD